MFLTTTGNVNHAYAAAQATVRSCAARNPMDLLLIGQMIALGLATLSSVSLSMEDNVPINQILRLRGNAVSLHRASEKCRRALSEPEPSPAVAHDTPLTDPELQHETGIIAEVEHHADPRSTPTKPREETATATAPTASRKPQAAPTATPFSPENNLRAACTLAFPDATQQEIEAIVKEAMAESRAESLHAAAPDPTTGPPPAAWSRAPSHFPDNRNAA